MRQVQIAEGVDTASAEGGAIWSNDGERAFVADTEFRRGDQIVFATNSLGCIGSEPTPGTPPLLFVGDELLLGPFWTGATPWPNLLAERGFAVVNGAFPGLGFADILDRHGRLRDRLGTVSAVVASGSWRDIEASRSNPELVDATRRFLEALRPNGTLLVATMPYGFSPKGGAEDWTQTAAKIGVDPAKFFLGAMPDGESLARHAAALQCYNDTVRKFCQDHGAVLIDMDAMLSPRTIVTALKDFADIRTFTPKVSSKASNFAHGILLDTVGAPQAAAITGKQNADTGSLQSLRKNIYPLW